jgi:FG-GAP-like repeat/FG-GAP repeat
MKRLSILSVALFVPCLATVAAEPTFKKQTLSEQFTSEGAHFADFDHDGHNDICAGAYLWKGPEFKTRVEYTAPSEKPYIAESGYSDYFLSYTYDFNSDGWSDILVYSWPGKETWVFENPQNKPGHWTRHSIFDVTDNESPALGDMNGDGKPELICQSSDGLPKKSGGQLGYAEINWNKPFGKARFRPITPVTPENTEKYFKYTHGYGFGDINGDGRPDLLTKEGWFEQPADTKEDHLWTLHPVSFAPEKAKGGSFMLVYDVNADGRNDVITSHDAHGYGFSWYEQETNGTFVEHKLMGSTLEDSPVGVKFSQLHAMQLADIDGDGVMDVVTGKRRWAHGPTKDEEPMADPVLYWFQIKRDGKGGATFIPHLIDSDSGVGTQVTPGDVNKDGKTDIVVSNKRGVFVFTQN